MGLLREVKERDGLVVFAWALMSNHFHIALRTGEVPLARSMKSLQQRVTRGYNVRHRVFGPLWQGRYRAKLVEDQRYLDGLLAYIHLNPVSAGVVDDPAEYRWSGHREIVGRTRNPITDVDEVLMQFGKTRRSARRSYVRAIKGTVGWRGAGEVAVVAIGAAEGGGGRGAGSGPDGRVHRRARPQHRPREAGVERGGVRGAGRGLPGRATRGSDRQAAGA